MSFDIIGTGAYVPERVVTNDELSQIVETNDEWITKRVGVKRRHVSENETAAQMGAEAARRALADAGIGADELDLIIAASVSSETVAPSVACMIQNYLGVSCTAFDINAACSAFLFLLETAAGFFARGSVKKVLVVGAERMSRVIDWHDRSTCVIFGDGAGAAVLSSGDGYTDSLIRVSGGDTVIKIPQHIGNSPFYKGEQESPYVHMNGQETFRFAVNSMAADIPELLSRNGLTADDIALIIPHQANIRIIRFAAEKMGIGEDRFFVNIEEYGNTSSASVPIALDEARRSGRIKKGDLVVLSAFGGGLSSAACLIKM